MSLTASEERALAGIERVLQARDLRLHSLFATFTSLTSQEAIPGREQLARRRGWRLRPIIAALLVIMLIVVITAICVLSRTSRACGSGRAAAAPGRPAASSARRRDQACPPRTSYTR